MTILRNALAKALNIHRVSINFEVSDSNSKRELGKWNTKQQRHALVLVKDENGSSGYLLVHHGRPKRLGGTEFPFELESRATWIASCYPTAAKNGRSKLLFPEWSGQLCISLAEDSIQIAPVEKGNLYIPNPKPLRIKNNGDWKEW